MKPLYQELPFAVDNYINFYREDLPHFIVPWHYHPEIEIMCIEKGWGTRFVGDHIGGYEEGDVCMMVLSCRMSGETIKNFSTRILV